MSGRPLTVEGGRQLRRELKAAGISVQDLKDAHREIAERVLVEAQRRAPVRTGRLRNALKPLGTEASAIVRTTGKTVPYANAVHWGWPSRPKWSKAARGGPIRSNPFVSEAVDAMRDEIYDDYLQAIEAILATVEGDTT